MCIRTFRVFGKKCKYGDGCLYLSIEIPIMHSLLKSYMKRNAYINLWYQNIKHQWKRVVHKVFGSNSG